MRSPDGCHTNERACQTPIAMIIFAGAWCVLEIVALLRISLTEYLELKSDDGDCAAGAWIRCIQVNTPLTFLFTSC